MDFLADENVPRPIIERLRSDGFTVHTIAEKSPGISDSHVLAVANEGGLILITQDQDFGELAIARQAPVTGAALLELARLPLNAQVERAAQSSQTSGHPSVLAVFFLAAFPMFGVALPLDPVPGVADRPADPICRAIRVLPLLAAVIGICLDLGVWWPASYYAQASAWGTLAGTIVGGIFCIGGGEAQL